MYIFVGLGNPGDEYENTRHNAGREILKIIAKKSGFSDWREEGKIKALVSEGKIKNEKVSFVLPNNFMNNSGKSVAPLIKSKKDLSRLVVVYDDLDLPLGKIKLSFDRSSGGHRGVESIIKNLKTREFFRVRVGVASATPTGKTKKPKGEKAVITYLLGVFKDKEIAEIKKLSKKISESFEMFVSFGKDKTLSSFKQ